MLVERTGLLSFSEPQMHGVRRQFSTEKGPDEEGDSARSSQAVEDTSSSGSSQHDAWVQFQQSIAVSGFETGQITKEKDLTKTKTRGGKLNRKRAEKEAEFEAFKRGDQIQVCLSPARRRFICALPVLPVTSSTNHYFSLIFSAG